MLDYHYQETTSRSNCELIPERAGHAAGAGANGTVTVDENPEVVR